MKKIISILLIFITVIYIPLTVKANSDEKILQDAREFLNQSTTIKLDYDARIIAKKFNENIRHAGNIPITRTNKNSGISLFITQDSGYTADVCIFTKDASTVLGRTQKAPDNTPVTLIWTANELGDNLDVLIYITCYRDISYRVWGSISY